MEILNNREWAIVIWAAIALCLMTLKKDIRKELVNVVKAFLNPKVIIPVILLFTYIVVEVKIGAMLSLWHAGLMKETVVWAVTSGLVMFSQFNTAAVEPKYFRRRILLAFKITVFIEVLINLYAFNLLTELVLQPFILLIVVLAAFAALDKTHKPVEKLMNGILVVIGIVLLSFAIGHIIGDWATLDKSDLVLQLLLPVWLSIGLLPFVYILALYASYETMFLVMRYTGGNHGNKPPLRIKVALLLGLNVRVRQVKGFNGVWQNKILRTKDLKTAFLIIRKYKKSLDI